MDGSWQGEGTRVGDSSRCQYQALNDGKWIWEKAYQYTIAESNIETGASCQSALGWVLLEQSSQALRGLLKEEQK